jgi:hypothetical protein
MLDLFPFLTCIPVRYLVKWRSESEKVDLQPNYRLPNLPIANPKTVPTGQTFCYSRVEYSDADNSIESGSDPSLDFKNLTKTKLSFENFLYNLISLTGTFTNILFDLPVYR